MRLKHIIKRMEFSEQHRSRLTIGTDTRLNPTEHYLQLKAGGGGYPTASDLFVKTWTTTPCSMKRWVGFMADLTNYRDAANQQVTDVRFRLSDGSQEFYWNTGASQWVPASSNNWNTEAEIATNIAAFPVSNQTIQVVINLSTTNAAYTPIVRSVRLLYESDLEEMEDYVWRSLIPDMRAKILPIADHHIEMETTGAVIDLNNFPIETPYEIASMDAVYDLDSDPRKLTNLLDSYNDATQEISLTSSITAGAAVLIRFVYRPVIAVSTSQDYREIEKVPEITLENISQGEIHPITRDHVLNKSTGEGKRVDTTQQDIEISARFITDKAKDHARLADAIKRYFADNPLLRSYGMDDYFRLWSMTDYDQDTTANQKDLHAGRFRFRIVSALFFDNDAVDIHGVLNFRLTLTQAP